ncbi:PREDICTED: protein sickie-like [Priapulus caudatus]|uniref:Protein sickie-like n=1 Tax=Priapulus caudatus TaxID=37621 RepID=A0ABM1EDD6_PRICU|nr:PREDICTED: protein sickie-like [Priapulus caudatus]
MKLYPVKEVRSSTAWMLLPTRRSSPSRSCSVHILLLEHRRIILCGPSGTGKSYRRLAEYLVLRSCKESSPGAIVDHKSNKEMRSCEHSRAV